MALTKPMMPVWIFMLNMWICVTRSYSHQRQTAVNSGRYLVYQTARQRSWPASFKSGYLIQLVRERISGPECSKPITAQELPTHFSKRLYDWSVLLRFVSRLLHSQRSFPSVSVAVRGYFSLLTESLRFPGILGRSEKRPLIQQEIWYLIFRRKFLRCLNQRFFWDFFIHTSVFFTVLVHAQFSTATEPPRSA